MSASGHVVEGGPGPKPCAFPLKKRAISKGMKKKEKKKGGEA